MTHLKLTRRAMLKSSVSALALGAAQGCAQTAPILGLSLNDAHDIRKGMYGALIEQEGLTEIGGSKHNSLIIQMHGTTSLSASDDETAWCSSAVNWAAKKAGTKGTNSAAARSWLDWEQGRSIPLEEAQRGDVVIFWRGSPSSWMGHVALYHGSAANSNDILVLGGNQDDELNISAYPKSRLLGVRRAVQ